MMNDDFKVGNGLKQGEHSVESTVVYKSV